MQEMSIQSGTVLEVGSDRMLVRIEKPGDACEGCRSCAVKVLCHGRADDHLDVRVPLSESGIHPEPGQNVRVAYRSANAAVAALVMFLPLLLGLFFGGYIAYRADGGDTVFLVGCGIGLLVGLAVTVAVSRFSKALKPEVWLVPENDAVAG